MIKSDIFKYPTVTISILTAVIALFSSNKAFAADPCDETRTVTVPSEWRLTQSGQSSTTLLHQNSGFLGNIESDTSTFNGNFTVTLQHTEPTVVCSGPTPPLPSEIRLDVNGTLTGSFNNPTSNSYVAFIPDINLISPGLTSQNFPGPDNASVTDSQTATLFANQGNINYTGSLNIESQFGQLPPSNSFGTITAQGNLSINGSLNGQIITQHTYEVPIPEPTTIIGSLLLGSGLIWRKSKNKG